MREQRAKGKYKRQPATDEKKKQHARNCVNNAIRDGTMEMATQCERCGANGYLEKHHHDYDKPFEIEWLCLQCHTEEHRKDVKSAEIA